MRHRTVLALAASLVITAMQACPALGAARLTDADRASMYAETLSAARHPIQVLGRACADPDRRRGCMRIPDAVRAGIEAKTEAPIRWVFRPWRHAGVFWVFGPIHVVDVVARYRFRWDDPRPHRCNGGGSIGFRSERGVWSVTERNGFVGCP
jgi:hypothetical protein